MPKGGPPKENVGPTQGWAGGPPSAPGPRTRTDAGLPRAGEPAASAALPGEEAQAEAERVASRSGERERDAEGAPRTRRRGRERGRGDRER